MTDLSTTDLTEAIDTYLTAYAEPDADQRSQLIARVWAADGELLDPPIEGRGHDGISAAAETLQAHFPDHTFRRTTGIDAHHAYARYEWELVAPDGAVAVTGLDVAQVDDEGRLCRIVGFLGPIPTETP